MVLHYSKTGFLVRTETGLWFAIVCSCLTSISLYPSAHTVAITFGAISFVFESSLAHLIVISFLPTPVFFPPL